MSSFSASLFLLFRKRVKTILFDRGCLWCVSLQVAPYQFSITFTITSLTHPTIYLSHPSIYLYLSYRQPQVPLSITPQAFHSNLISNLFKNAYPDPIHSHHPICLVQRHRLLLSLVFWPLDLRFLDNSSDTTQCSWISWCPRLAFKHCCRNLEFTITRCSIYIHLSNYLFIHPSDSYWLRIVVYVHVLRLTAFVLKSFVQAKAFIFVDDEEISRGASWLLSQQRSDGAFTPVGRLFNKVIQVARDLITHSHWYR